MSTQNRKSLKERAEEMKVQLPLMENRTAAAMDDLIGIMDQQICDYGFLKSREAGKDEQEYAVFIVKDDPDHFYFGGTVITNRLKELDEEGYHDEIVADGLPVYFHKAISKDKMIYTNAILFPTDEDLKRAAEREPKAAKARK